LLSADGAEFYWPAIAGVWKPHIGGGTPRDFGPCGDVLDCDAPLLFADLERRYGYFRAVSPAVREALLVPFHVSGRAVGTLWAVFHGDRHFDAEDLRRLQSLGRFASVAYQSTQLHVSDKTRREAALNLMEDAVESRQEMERVNADLRALESKTHEQAASLAELNRRKDHFLAMLSHELRNPLASIRAAAAVMRRRDDLDTIQMQAQEMIERQVSQLARLIDDLLEVSRISTGRIHLRLDRVDLRDIVHRAVQSMRQQTDQKGQSIEESLAEGPQWMQGDAARLEQIVVNLLSNASKYTDRGGRIVVGLQEDGDELVLRVKDTGVGISPELLPHIFELFMQVDESLDKSQGGLGLGLALVQSLVSLHRGRVEVFSTPGEGSEFLIRFPITASAATEIVPADPISAALDGLRVLVVDDNQDAAQSIGLLLETSGHSIRLAYNGPSALAEARSFTPDVVLLDIGLPVLSGFEVAKSIRMEPTLRDTVLVALTGYAQDSDRLRTREAGFDYHLVKPVDFESLDSILAAVAARRAGTSGLH
jgi:signal transduction histidine kinase/ActR/RegA family two-component response regulator